ncbi:MAG: N-acetylglucosamine-6-phosphate deacetylase NagA [Pseudomonadota bacterium]
MTEFASHWLCPDQIFDGATLRRGMALGVKDGRATTLVARAALPQGTNLHPVPGTITPGYLDLQVNGGGDVLLNNAPTAASMGVIAAAHRTFGTVGILPTVITSAPDILRAAVAAAIEAKGMDGILGLHIEGPHISIPRRGTHAAKYVRPLDQGTMDLIASLRDHAVFVKITLAPESVQPGQIARLVGLGAVVSIGHSDATSDEVERCLAEGATCFTHLFNAMSPMLNRAPGVTGAAINSDAYCGIICDGHHVADQMLSLAIRARPVPNRMFLVSDSMSTIGGSDRFELYGQKIKLSGGRLINAEGSLAGAHTTMAESVARAINVLNLPAEQALQMATSVPAGLIGHSTLGQVTDRRLQDLLVLDPFWMPTGTCATKDALAA